MSLSITSEPVPIKADNAGVLRVGGTRVSLDTVVSAFQNGATPEQIADDFPTLNLADIYAVIGFYLSHREEVEKYLSVQQRDAAELRSHIEECAQTQTIRQRLLERRAQRNMGDATPGG